MVKAGASAHTTEGNSRASRGIRVGVFTLARAIYRIACGEGGESRRKVYEIVDITGLVYMPYISSSG